MVNLRILAGGYTSFVATYVFDTDTSTLSLASQSNTGVNPSWITFHPVNKSILYAVNELETGALQSFVVDAEGKLGDPLSTVPSNGNSPAYAASIGNDLVAVMNYGSGNGMIIPTTSTTNFVTNAGVIEFPAAVSHPHMALQVGGEVLVPDLGADKVWRLVQESEETPGQWRIQGFVEQPAGSGPRHIAVEGNILYTLHEVSSTLISQQIPAAPNGTSPIISNLSIVPQDAPQNATFAAAEILFPTPNTAFPGRYVYVSNRNIGPTFDPRGDSIAVFAAAGSGELTLVRHVFTGLQQIRGMQFGGVDNKFLIAGANTQGGVAMFERTGDGGDLNLLATNLELQNRTSFAFLEDVESVDEPVGDGESTEEGRLVTVSSAPTGVQNGEPQPQADNQTVASDSSAPTAQAWLSTVMAQVLLLAMIFTLA